MAEFQEQDAARAVGVPMDVTDPASVARAFKEIIAHWGGVDIVVLNAGIALACPLIEMDLEAFRRLERVNVEVTFLSCRGGATVCAAEPWWRCDPRLHQECIRPRSGFWSL